MSDSKPFKQFLRELNSIFSGNPSLGDLPIGIAGNEYWLPDPAAVRVMHSRDGVTTWTMEQWERALADAPHSGEDVPGEFVPDTVLLTAPNMERM